MILIAYSLLIQSKKFQTVRLAPRQARNLPEELEIIQTFQKVSRRAGNHPDNLESFQINQKILDNVENFQPVKKIQTIWKVSRRA